jgi:hypothetical protein
MKEVAKGSSNLSTYLSFVSGLTVLAKLINPQVATKLMVRPSTIEIATFYELQSPHLKKNLPVYPIS